MKFKEKVVIKINLDVNRPHFVNGFYTEEGLMNRIS